jgi:glutathione synthase
MDPLGTLSLKKDSTLAMIRAAQRRAWNIFYLEQSDLVFRQNRTFGLMRPLALSGRFAETLDPYDSKDGWYTLGAPVLRPLGEVDVVLMRKDPPFDMEYVYTTYLLERAEREGAFVVNKPQSLRDCNEKFFATSFTDCTPPLVVTRREDQIREFQAEQKNIVLKRLDGMGGASVFRILEGDGNIGVIIETLTRHGQEQVMAQRYLPEIKDGDKRILLVDGDPVPFALARIPKAGEVRGNLAAGGTGIGRPLTARDRYIAERVGPEVKRRGLYFVGIDVIGDYLTEVNVTCPTCIRELDAQFGLDIGASFIDVVAAKLANRDRESAATRR